MSLSNFLFGDQLHKQSSGLMDAMDFSFSGENMGRGQQMFAPQRMLQEANLRRQMSGQMNRLQGAPGLTAAAREQMQQGVMGQYQQGMMQTGAQFASMANQADLNLWGQENQMRLGAFGTEEQIRASRFANQGGGFMDWLGGAASTMIGGFASAYGGGPSAVTNVYGEGS